MKGEIKVGSPHKGGFKPRHHHLQVQANSKKIAEKKGMLFLVSMGETGLCHDIFFNSHLSLSRSLRSNGNWPLNFEAATSKFGNYS